MYVAEQTELEALTAKELQNPIDRNWRITSYSGLVKQGSHHAEHDATIEIIGFDIDSSEEQDEAELVEPERSIFNFPRGARPGTFCTAYLRKLSLLSPRQRKRTPKSSSA